jgi:hypothetical protein
MTKEKGGAVYEALPVLWHETSVPNTSPKYIGHKNSRSRHSYSEVNDKGFAQIVVPSRIPAPGEFQPHPALFSYIRSRSVFTELNIIHQVSYL